MGLKLPHDSRVTSIRAAAIVFAAKDKPLPFFACTSCGTSQQLPPPQLSRRRQVLFTDRTTTGRRASSSTMPHHAGLLLMVTAALGAAAQGTPTKAKPTLTTSDDGMLTLHANGFEFKSFDGFTESPSALRRTLDTTVSDISSLQEDLQGLSTVSQDRYDNLAELITKLENELPQFASDLEAVQTEIKHIDTAIADAITSIGAIATDVATKADATTVNQAINQATSMLEQQGKGLNSSIDSVKNTMAANKAAADAAVLCQVGNVFLQRFAAGETHIYHRPVFATATRYGCQQ